MLYFDYLLDTVCTYLKSLAVRHLKTWKLLAYVGTNICWDQGRRLSGTIAQRGGWEGTGNAPSPVYYTLYYDVIQDTNTRYKYKIQVQDHEEYELKLSIFPFYFYLCGARHSHRFFRDIKRGQKCIVFGAV